MADESEEACLVNPKSPLSGSIPGQMQYTDGLNAPITSTSTAQHPSSTQQPQSTTIHANYDPNNDPYNINDDIILSQFHADAIKQVIFTTYFVFNVLLKQIFFSKAGCGKFQFIATCIVGLGLAGHVIQVYSIFYILPSAEVEYCILDDEKGWISNITLLGIGCGALLWGALAGKNGRRRALLSCLAVSSVFSGK